ncbi:hypothetical protein Q7278_08815 [Glaesserella parasuis]|nr:hypothetical protein [Glaesserella parasuis]
MEFDDNRFAVLEWGSAFRWGEHYVLIQGTKQSSWICIIAKAYYALMAKRVIS